MTLAVIILIINDNDTNNDIDFNYDNSECVVAAVNDDEADGRQ